MRSNKKKGLDAAAEKLLAAKRHIPKTTAAEIGKKVDELGVHLTAKASELVKSIGKLDDPEVAMTELPVDVQRSIPALRPIAKRFHGLKVELAWFPGPFFRSPCADKFGYMAPGSVRSASKLAFNVTNQALLGQLGDMMGDPGRDSGADSALPAGFTYFGQFVDHDITLDVSSTLDAATDATTINNMRSPALDLDAVYGRGPAMDPFMYDFPPSGPIPPSAIKMQLGTNTATGPGGPGGTGGIGGMVVQTDWDLPRANTAALTALIGDPRNDENLIVSQFHHAMLRFHNRVVDMLVLAAFPGDIFVEAKKIVIHHYQWAVVNDFLKRICGPTAVADALANVVAPVGSTFRMPVEFSVAAYRFGHSLIRNRYWVNFNFPTATLDQVFEFARVPRLPVFSNWVVDMNAFFDTGVTVPVNNKARKIDSVLAAGLETLPGFSGMMSILATRNLRRGLALGLPSGQAMATWFGMVPMTPAQLTSGLLPDEVNVLNANGGALMNKTPLWYYILRESAVLEAGERLGPVGAKIVADTFIRILKRDADSYLNASSPFTPILPSATAGDFTVADLLIFAGVTQP